MSDHMESPTNPARSRCGRNVNSLPGLILRYGSINTTCKTCQRLYDQDMAKNETYTHKCTRSDCGLGPCFVSVTTPQSPEFCVYDFDEAHWDKVKDGDDK